MSKIDDVIQHAGKAADVLDATYDSGKKIAQKIAGYSDEIMAGYSKLGDIPDFSKMTVDEIGEWATSGNSYMKGLKGEFLAGINQKGKHAKSFDVDGRTRIADEINNGILTEVKNKSYVANTKQLRDYEKYAADETLEKILYVRPGATVSPAVKAAGWRIEYLW